MYAEHRPAPDLAGHLRCGWMSVTTGPVAVLPDGCLDLMWLGGELVVAGPDTTAMPSDLPAGTEVAAVRFRPGAAPAVLGLPAAELRDRRVPLAELWPDAARLADQVAGAAGPAARVAVLQDTVRGRLPDAPPVDPLARAVAATLARGPAHRSPADGTGPAGVVAALAARAGLSERQLHRRCLVAFGYGAKTLARILRLNRAVAAASAGAPFATVAADCGYADQAHLSREFAALAGAPPTAFPIVQDRARDAA